MPSNAAAPKSDIPRKTPPQKRYLDTVRDKVAYDFIKTAPHVDVPQETSKNQRAATLKNHFE